MQRPSIILGFVSGAAIAAAVTYWQPGVRVVDGDTVRHGFWTWRLDGFDTPEIGSHAKCPQERAAGRAAAARLNDLLSTGEAVLAPTSSIWRGDKYGRRLGRLTVNGRDVAGVLIAEGHARPYSGGAREGWCP